MDKLSTDHNLSPTGSNLNLSEASTMQVSEQQPDLPVGTEVEWTSQASGRVKQKRGTIVAIIPARTDPLPKIREMQRMYKAGSEYGGGSHRGEVSFIVLVPGATEASKPRVYWPLTARLRKVAQAPVDKLSTGQTV